MVHPLFLRFLGILALCPLPLGAYYAFDIGGSAGMASKTDDGPTANTIEGVFTMAGQTYSHAMNQALYSAYAWPNAVFAIVCGQLIDHHWSLEKSTFAFSAMVSVGLSVFAVALVGVCYPVMVIARVVYGIGGEGIWVAVHVWKDRFVKGTPLTAVGAGVVIGCARLAGTFQFLTGTRIGSSWTVFGLAATCIVWAQLSLVGAALIVWVYPKLQVLALSSHTNSNGDDDADDDGASMYRDRSHDVMSENGSAFHNDSKVSLSSSLSNCGNEADGRDAPLLFEDRQRRAVEGQHGQQNGTQLQYSDSSLRQSPTPREIDLSSEATPSSATRRITQSFRWFWTEAFPLYRLKALSPGAWLVIATIAAFYPALIPFFGFAKNAFQVRASMSADEAGEYVALGEALCAVSCPAVAALITVFKGRLPIFLCASVVALTALHFVSAITSAVPPLLHVCLLALFYGVANTCSWPLLGIIGKEDVHGISYGAAVSGETLTQAILPLIVGPVLDHFTLPGASLASAGGYQAADALLGVVAAISVFLSFAVIVWDCKANGGKLCRGRG